MRNVAMIKDGVVVNVAVWDGVSAWSPGNEYTLIDVTDNPSVGIDWTYDGQDFSRPQD